MKDKHHSLIIHQTSDPSSATQNFLQNYNQFKIPIHGTQNIILQH